MRAHRHNIRVLTCAAAGLGAIVLSGCFGAGGKVEQPTTMIAAPRPEVKPLDVKPICGTIKKYTAAEMKALADAITALDEHSPVVTAMGDYKRMRDEAHACVAASGDGK